jgi:hypothetical protein
MKECPECHINNGDAAQQCTECGASFVGVVPARSVYGTTKKAILIAAVVLVSIIAVVVYCNNQHRVMPLHASVLPVTADGSAPAPETKEQRAERERAEKQARLQSATDQVMRMLKTEFSYLGSGSQVQLTPGAGLGANLLLCVKNNSAQPIDDVRIVIGPAEYLDLSPYYYERERASLNTLTSTGLPTTCRGTDKTGVILPSNSRYYPQGSEVWWVPVHSGLLALCLSRKLSPGRDVQLHAYLVIKGVKEPAGTITVHVMYPQ